MKKIIYIFLAMVSFVTITSCDTDADTVAEVKDEAGFLINFSATSGTSILGSPEAGVDLADATVTISTAYLNMTISKVSGSTEGLEKIEIVKSYNGGEEIAVGESTTLPFNLVVDNLTKILSGTGVTPTALRIGDKVTFRAKITQKDGDVYYYNASMGDFNVVVNCSADLTGTYLVTNSSCAPSFTTTISKNADGTWLIGSADGGWLHQCTGNSTLLNSGSISVVCGDVLPTGNLDFGSDGGTYDIGDITGGSWDANAGVLTMTHLQTLWSTRDGTWTSTYTRQ